ncbi:MAG: DUF692 domain-containing protein [Limisphaerales bacterium]
MKTATQDLPCLGVGLGFRDRYSTDLFSDDPGVDFLEITADHFFEASASKQRQLELLRDRYTLIPHGLDLSLGSAEGLDAEYLSQLANLVNALNPPWWSEHIACTRAGGIQIGHLSPVPFNEKGRQVVVQNIHRVQEQIPVPLILENITYDVTLPGGSEVEGEFLARIMEETGCGLLLDITNLYTNTVNHGLDATVFLNALPAEHVVQLHFTGGHEANGRLVDSHSRATPEPVWDLMATVLQQFPVKGIILERDENLPPYEELRAEMHRARQLGRTWNRWS